VNHNNVNIMHETKNSGLPIPNRVFCTEVIFLVLNTVCNHALHILLGGSSERHIITISPISKDPWW